MISVFLKKIQTNIYKFVFVCILSYHASIMSEFSQYLECILNEIQTHTFMYVSACILSVSDLNLACIFLLRAVFFS